MVALAPIKEKFLLARNVTRKPDPVEYHVGQRTLSPRRELGLNQTVLGNENGANRICAGRLYEISQALRTEVETFFEGAPNNVEFKKLAAISDDPIAIRTDR